VYVVIGCDTDPDREGFFDGVPPPAERLTWRGMTEGIPALKAALRGVRDSAGREPVFTWLLRADEQVRQLEGDYAWAVKSHRALFADLQAGGDELGWHPHFWRRDSASGPWFQEVADLDWQVEMLHQAHRALAASLPGGALRSVRMGWVYHNNRTYAALEQLGVTIDFSAMPGFRTFRGAPPARGNNLFDWYATPPHPYWPSRSDYRRPPQDAEPAFQVLEVPYFISRSRVWGLIGGLQLARKTRDVGQLWDALRRPTYCINLTARPRYFAPLIAALRKAVHGAATGPLVFATGFHPDELLPNRSALYDPESVRANLSELVRVCQTAGWAVEFAPAARLPAVWSKVHA
jgi:hypothetical protein